MINNHWKSQLTVLGVEGLPADIASAGNVLYKEMKFRCSLRIPPGMKGTDAAEILQKHLTYASPDTFGAEIEFKP